MRATDMSTLLVTGGGGFIGTNFVRHWLRRHANDRVLNYDMLSYAANLDNFADLPADQKERLAHVKGDIGDYDLALATLRRHRVDAVVNFAAESHNSRALLNPDAFFQTNVMGTMRLMRAVLAAEVPRFHHVSTCEVYGDLPLDSPCAFDEQAPLKPKTPYNASKAAADLAVRTFTGTFGLPATISVCSNNYGPYQFPEKVIPALRRQLPAREADDPLPAEPQQARMAARGRPLPCHRVDPRAHGEVGQTYNVGSGIEIDVEGIAARIIECLGLDESAKVYVPDRPSHDRRYLLDSSKIRKQLGWAPEVDFEDGFRRTVLWYRDNPQWWRPLLERLEVDEANWQNAR